MAIEREVILTGVGGQGVQLAGQVLARAALLEDRHVMLLGVYGGSMRGGNTDATLVVGDAPISAPPIVSHAWAALAMHALFWAPIAPKLRPGAVVVVNAPLFDAALDRAAHRVFEVPATERAAALGAPQSAAMFLVGAFARLTALVGIESLGEAMGASLPPYRRQHLAGNVAALRAGWDAAPGGGCVAPAWVAEAGA
jgi:Pyruvate/2-oxoacid:ferredoxin oxidoreductase gamma subunit